MLAIKLAMEGTANLQIANDLGRSQVTVQTWINLFRTGDIEALLGKGNGHKSRLTPEMELTMIAELTKGQWRTSRDASNWLGSKFDLGDMKEFIIYKYLGKCAEGNCYDNARMDSFSSKLRTEAFPKLGVFEIVFRANF